MNRTLVEKRELSATEERELYKNVFVVAPGVWRLKDIFVNIFIIQNREGTGWVLVDAGLQTSAPKIKAMAEYLFGSSGSTPQAIVMTHGHFDHRGALLQLAEEWGAPIYCHHQETPYLTGQAAYPPPDPAVGGGLMALASFAYPKGPINVAQHLSELPEDGTVPGVEDWRWLHTPGHTPGHISLFREKDGVLVAGDAFVTTMQESAISVLIQKKVIWGPPKYFTPDWGAAARSVRALAALEPNVIVTGHGQAMYGDEARKALNKLSRNFWQRGIPAQGRYVKEPAQFDENGVPTYIPPGRGIMLKRIAIAAGLLAIGILIYRERKQGSFFNRKALGSLGKSLIGGAMATLGATAPATPALPMVPLIPAL